MGHASIFFAVSSDLRFATSVRLVIVLPLIALLCALSACGRPVPPEKAAYVGEWRGTGVDLSIEQDGTVAYTHVHGGMRKSLELPLEEFQVDNFVVGIGPLSTTFLVAPPPHRDGSDWKMTVDGVELTKLKD